MNIPSRFKLRDLPLPAKLVLSVFLMALGLGYIAAMMQLHLKSGSRDGSALPTVKDVVMRYSGSCWPPKPAEKAAENKEEAKKPTEGAKQKTEPQPAGAAESPTKAAAGEPVAGVAIRTLINTRCAECHKPEGEKDDVPLHTYETLAEILHADPKQSKMHKVLTGPADKWSADSMVQAFTVKSSIGEAEWKKAFPKLTPDEQQKLQKQRDAERSALIAWVLAGSKKEHYDADFFPLPENLKSIPLTPELAAIEPGSAPKSGMKEVPKSPQPEPSVEDQSAGGPTSVKIQTLIAIRCASCHKDEKRDVPLDNFDDIARILVHSDAHPFGKMHTVIRDEAAPNRWGKDSMRKAFTEKSDGWKDAIKARREADVRAERENERRALVAWIEAGAPKEAYDANAFEIPAGRLKGSITKEMVVGTADPIRPLVALKQIDFDSLVQSTHAHMLTFALLWTATGLIFAFSSYPLWMRVAIAPTVLAAQVADVLCWWLARLPDVGPYFAVAILGTGAIVGLGVSLQILLSLFDMYGSKGKFVLLLICVLGVGGLGTVFIKYVEPELVVERKEAVAPKQP